MNYRHASEELPKHPITGSSVYHPDMIHPMMVAVREDAHVLYVNDERWCQAESVEKDFALRMIMEIAGGCYPVMSTDRDHLGTFYNIKIEPAVFLNDPMGVRRRFNAAFVPADYTRIVRGVFPEAK